MVASVRNGFRHIVWDPVNFTCNGRPYAFHAMYDRALPPLPNGQPTAWTTWSAHTDNVAYDVETGHFEPPDAASDATSRTRRRPAVLHRSADRRVPGVGLRLRRLSRITPAIGPTGGRTPRRRTTSARPGRAASASIRSHGSRPTCPASRRPTTAARCPATTTPARAAPIRRRARSIRGTTCLGVPRRSGGVRGRSPTTGSPARSPTSEESKPAGVRLSGPTTGSTSGSTTMRGSFPTCAPNRSSGAAPDRRRDCCRRGGVDRDRAG